MAYYWGTKIKELRVERNWTQKDLSRRLHKSVSTISGYESDAHPLPMDVLVSLAKIFGVSLDELVGREKPNILSTQNLTEQQIKILESLRAEYLVPTGRGKNLTDAQMKILQGVIQSFLE